ncbi:hypothetical protein [Amycolatopsis sp. GM8]|uniref:hypothetical protein n=1 Tax=Amycolatopsis sp. GM8 TaxID=2896530 RepID=UPI001F34180F|nr:hypothetical protein [Amycolatopsis sp. GM8]
MPVTTVAPEVAPPTISTTTPAPPPPVTTEATKPKPTSTRKTSPRTTTKRAAPQYGYQCRDGDDKVYSVCAGHKAWVDGQLDYANCLDSGGTWNIERQRCDHQTRPTVTGR